MKESFETFLYDQLGLSPKDHFLLAVSGGMDSMCMWDLFRKSKLNYVVAHCNFKLRDDESDGDENFVKEHALPDEKVFVKSFDTALYAKEHSISIQMAARELRYKWFGEIKEKEKCDFIATAHHLDDQVETFFIQLLRKNNLPGLTGMPVKTDILVRPLMFMGRESIETYVENQKIPFREDRSNASDVYLRNRIRRNLIPIMQKVLPDFKSSILELMGNMSVISKNMQAYFDKKREEIVSVHGDDMHIAIEALKSMDFPNIFLETLLKPKGFSQTAIRNLYDSIDGRSGTTFYSSQYKIVKDRQVIILAPIVESDEMEIIADKMQLAEGAISFIDAQLIPNSANVMQERSERRALLDLDKVSEKVVFRKWKQGDHFYPLGMGGKKKLSDYFVDKKMTLLEKEHQWIMLSDGEICWIVGRAIDDRFKIRENTKVVLLLEKV